MVRALRLLGDLRRGIHAAAVQVSTIAAGAAHMGLLPFTLGSLVGRGARFLFVAGLVRWGGAPIEHQVQPESH